MLIRYKTLEREREQRIPRFRGVVYPIDLELLWLRWWCSRVDLPFVAKPLFGC